MGKALQIRAGTQPNPERKNDAKRLEAVAHMLGYTLIPWQQYVAQVATEIDPDTGSYYYDTVVLTTPRQCGKSALVDASSTYNASLGQRRRIVYAAQTGKDSEDHFKEYYEQLTKSRLRQKVAKGRFSNGNMNVTFSNGSIITPMAMTKVAGHGKQMDLVTIDEAFSLTLEQGNSIMDAIVPTMNTRLKATGVTAQRWITSTEGTSESTYFNTLLDGLRAGDVPKRTCWFDFGIPDDADAENLETIMTYHPAAGYLWYKKQLHDFRDSFEGNAAGWARAFGNRRDIGVVARIIPLDLWQQTTVPQTDPATLDGTTISLGVAVDIDATATAISAAWNTDGMTVTQLVEVLDGTGSAPQEIQRLAEKYKATVCMDSKGPGASLYTYLARTDEYGQSTTPLVDMNAGEYMQTGQHYVSGLENHTIVHAADAVLDESAANSTRAWSGDAWRITRKASAGSTAPLESCMLAAWAASKPQDSGIIQIY